MAQTRRHTAFPLTGTALVTGASSGLGIQYAEQLARAGMDLILVARSADALQRVADGIVAKHGRAVTILPTDLTDREARGSLVADIQSRGLPVDVLVNNAGFGTVGPFAEFEPERIVNEIELNCVALSELARTYLPAMLSRSHGAIINLASTAGFQPLPRMSVYAATKAYVRSFSQALWAETRGTGVRVLCVCPGPTETQFFANTGSPGILSKRRAPEQVVMSTFRALNRDVPEVIDGPLNRVTAVAAGLLPKRVVMPVGRRITEEH